MVRKAFVLGGTELLLIALGQLSFEFGDFMGELRVVLEVLRIVEPFVVGHAEVLEDFQDDSCFF